MLVSQRGFLFRKTQTCSKTLSIPTGTQHPATVSLSPSATPAPGESRARVKAGTPRCGEAHFSKRVPRRQRLSTKKRRQGTGSVQGTGVSTCAFRLRGGKGRPGPGALPGPGGATGSPRGSAAPAGSRKALLTSRDWWAQQPGPGRARRREGWQEGGLRGREAGRRASRVPGLRALDSSAGFPQPRPGPPRRREEGGTRRAAPGGRGTLASGHVCPRPLWAAHPFLPAPGERAAGRETRQETLLAGQGLREAGAEPRARTHPQPAGWTWILRTSQQSPTSSNSVTSPASFSSGVTQKSVVEVHNWWVVNLVSQMSSKSFKRKQFR